MYTITHSHQFKKSFKRHTRSGSFPIEKLKQVIRTLESGQSLPSHNKNHPLKGNWNGYWECHVEYDFLLVYEIDGTLLTLVDIGSHAYIFGM